MQHECKNCGVSFRTKPELINHSKVEYEELRRELEDIGRQDVIAIADKKKHKDYSEGTKNLMDAYNKWAYQDVE